jgi:hypothetical protein
LRQRQEAAHLLLHELPLPLLSCGTPAIGPREVTEQIEVRTRRSE